MNPETSMSPSPQEHRPSDSFGLIDDTAYEERLLEHFTFKESMTASEYARQFADNWSRYGHMRRKVILRTVDQSVKHVVETRTQEEIAAAVEVLVAKGQELQGDTQRTPWVNDAYLRWITSVRRLANFTHPINGSERTRAYVVVEPSDDKPDKITSSEIFWQRVYMRTTREEQAATAFANYVFGPGIEQKDSDVLSRTVERLHDEPIENIFDGSLVIDSKNPVKVMRAVYDSFRKLVKEAAESGWENAAAIDRLLDSYPKRDAPHQALIIQAGNNVAEIMRQHKLTPEGMNLEHLSNRRVANVGDSIQRCLYLIFETGKRPVNHDPLNYLLVGELLKAVSQRAATLESAPRR